MLADEAFDANWIIGKLDERGAAICISKRSNRKEPRDIDEEIYKWRHLIESFFCKLKAFKAIALRCEKTDRNFNSMIYDCAAVIKSRRTSTNLITLAHKRATGCVLRGV